MQRSPWMTRQCPEQPKLKTVLQRWPQQNSFWKTSHSLEEVAKYDMIIYFSEHVVPSSGLLGSKWHVVSFKSSWLKQITIPEPASCSFLSLYFLEKTEVVKLVHFATEHPSAEILLSLVHLCHLPCWHWFLSFVHRNRITEYITSACQLLQI